MRKFWMWQWVVVPLRAARSLDVFLLKMYQAEFRIVINWTSDPGWLLENDASSDKDSFDKTMFYTQGRCGANGPCRLSRKICSGSTTVTHKVTSRCWLLWTRSLIRDNAWQLTPTFCTIQLCICSHICNMFRPDLMSIFTESIYVAACDSLIIVQQIGFNSLWM